jgi:hypothetical protein
MPRRSTKTSSIFAWITGMCVMHPRLQVAYTAATTGKSARDRFTKEIRPEVERARDAGADLDLRTGAGQERVIFGNGSLFQILAPIGNEFRGQAYDVVVIDEAGEGKPEKSEELLAAALPTLATSWLGMLIVTGTAGEYRTGNLLWDSLQSAQAGDAASVDYSLGDEIDMERLDDWDYTAAMLQKYHPSVGNLITLEHLKLSWRMMDRRLFAREYLGLWGDASGDGGLFSEDAWANLQLLDPLPDPPKRFALGVAASEDNASIVAAWRDSHGEARLVLLDHREGRAWLPAVARDLARRYRVPVVLDPRASQVMADVKQRLEQLRPAPRVEVQTYEDVAAAHERILQEIDNATVRHYGQESMTTAFLRVKRTQMGAKWKFGRINDADDITPAQAAILALRYYDANPRVMNAVLAPVAV